jgi:hypothetical protein
LGWAAPRCLARCGTTVSFPDRIPARRGLSRHLTGSATL